MTKTGDNTARKTGLAEPWKPGQSGNPAGRPKSARNKLSEAFIEALTADFAQHGIATIERVRAEKPEQYLKVVAGLLPKDLNVRVTDDLEAMTDDEVIQRIRELDKALQEYLASSDSGKAKEKDLRH